MAKRPRRRCYKLRYYLRLFFTHLFSQVGLCALVVGYSVVGAFLFEFLESRGEGAPLRRPPLPREKRQEIADLRTTCLQDLWNINVNLPLLKKQNWTAMASARLRQLEDSIIGAVTTPRPSARAEVVDWSFSSALLYSVTVITTIGYGHITPRTDGGKIMTIFYALVGVPLMLLCLTNIGQLMANTFRFTYWSCSVIWRPRRQQATRTAVRYAQKRSPVTAEEDGGESFSPAPDAGRVRTVSAGSAGGGRPPEDLTAATGEDGRATGERRGSGPGSAPATPLRELDGETRQILVECAEYVISEELGIHLESGSQRGGSMARQQSSGSTPATEVDGVEPAAVDSGGTEELDSVISLAASALAVKSPPLPASGAGNHVTSTVANHVTFSTPAVSEARPRAPPTPPRRNSSLAARVRGRDSPQRLPCFPSATAEPAPRSAPRSASLPPARRRSDSSRSPARPPSADVQSLGPPTPRRKPGSPYRRHVSIEHPHMRKLTREEKRLRRLTSRQNSDLSGVSQHTLLSTPSSLDSGVYSASARFTFPDQLPGPVAAVVAGDELVQVEVVKVAPPTPAGRVPIPLVLGFVTMYICMGAGIFAWWEEWPFLDGAYFCFITLSTIGFGDLVPGTKVLSAETREDQLKLVFCCLYLILGLAIIAMSFSLVQEEVVVKCKAVGRCTGILYDSDAEED